MPQRLGEYRDRIIIQQRSEAVPTVTNAGEPTTTWSEHAVRWAKRSPMKGGESFEDDVGRMANMPVQFRTHVTRGVAPKMRVRSPGAVTTLAASLATGGTSMTVADASGFPLEGRYRLRVGAELMEVTAGQGTTSWTVTRRVDGTSTTGSYATGQAVQHMQAHDVEGAHIDWQFGAETVIQTRLSDGIAA